MTPRMTGDALDRNHEASGQPHLFKRQVYHVWQRGADLVLPTVAKVGLHRALM